MITCFQTAPPIPFIDGLAFNSDHFYVQFPFVLNIPLKVFSV